MCKQTSKRILQIVVLFVCATSTAKVHGAALETSIKEAMKTHRGACVFINCKSGGAIVSDTAAANERLTPCSSFKIWNTLIGAECGLVPDPDKVFYKWDGETRSVAAWNRDLTLKEAFKVSCVPAFQSLARKIGYTTMQTNIETIGYGDRDISSGIDDFWLPKAGKKSIEISPFEQAHLICELVNGKLPFSKKSRAILEKVMLVKKSPTCSYFGKTGSGSGIRENPNLSIGWFVGYVVSKETTFSFACLLKGEQVSGADAKAVIEAILVDSGIL